LKKIEAFIRHEAFEPIRCKRLDEEIAAAGGQR
jgi:hypothetical protein